jgi:hypothetical protein
MECSSSFVAILRKDTNTTLLKKIDFFSTEKNGNTQRKMALFSALTLALKVTVLKH